MARDGPQWHSLPAEQVLAELACSPDGLTASEAAERLRRDGPNTLPRKPPPSLAAIVLRQFRSPLIYLLAAAAAVSVALEEIRDAAFIGGVLLINALIGSFQESRAERASQALQSLLRIRATVRRDGQSCATVRRDPTGSRFFFCTPHFPNLH